MLSGSILRLSDSINHGRGKVGVMDGTPARFCCIFGELDADQVTRTEV